MTSYCTSWGGGGPPQASRRETVLVCVLFFKLIMVAMITAEIFYSITEMDLQMHLIITSGFYVTISQT